MNKRSDQRDTLTEHIDAQAKYDDADAARMTLNWADIPALAIFAMLFAVVFLQFSSRYAFGSSVSWTEEAARYLLILLAFVGAVKCQVIDGNIRLEVIDVWAGRHLRSIKIFALAVSAGFFSILASMVVVLIGKTSFQQMVSLPFPKYYLYGAIFVALIALTLTASCQLIAQIRHKEA
jgi:TRAP-type C4-dicarboxylate transport system permease small subunit